MFHNFKNWVITHLGGVTFDEFVLLQADIKTGFDLTAKFVREQSALNTKVAEKLRIELENDMTNIDKGMYG